MYKLDIKMDETAESLACRPLTAISSRENISLPMRSPLGARPTTSPAVQSEERLPLTVNISDSLKSYCGSSLNVKTSQYTSMGLGSYQHVVDHIWDDDQSVGTISGESWIGKKESKETPGERKARGYVTFHPLLILCRD
jgi:hypothetical protein